MLPVLLSIALAGTLTLVLPDLYRRIMLKRRLREQQRAVDQIGNAHQYVRLGETYRQLEQWPESAAAFEQAVKRDGESLPARFGLAVAKFAMEDFAAAESQLRDILAVDPQYKFGDVSLLLAKSLAAQKKSRETATHLIEHVRRWRQPEALLLLGIAQKDIGDTSAARHTLQGLLQDIDNTPQSALAQRFVWKRRAKRVLREL